MYNIKPEHFAQQLTYLDQRYLLAMSPRELLYCEHVMDDTVSGEHQELVPDWLITSHVT